MGLNFYPRPPRHRLDPPNGFVAGALGNDDVAFSHILLEDEVLVFEDEILRGVQERVAKVGFPSLEDPA